MNFALMQYHKYSLAELNKLDKAINNHKSETIKKTLENNDKKEKEAGLALFRAHRGLPKNKALIKLLGEQGVTAIMRSTENFYLQDQQKEMHKADEPLFFTIDEKNNTIELRVNY